jgi:uncharacterized protein YfdQ (DUF2303 family)
VTPRSTYSGDVLEAKPTRTEADAIAEAGRRGGEPRVLAPGQVHAIPTATGVQIVDLDTDQYRGAPLRKTGTTNVRDVAAFAQYYAKHSTPDVSEVYANLDANRITAVLDANGADTPGWAEHRLVLTVRRTRNWETWAKLDGEFIGQTAFAEHIEANLGDIAEPAGADLLELCQTFQATTEVAFKSGSLLANGARELQYTETVEASGGRTKQIQIPKGLTLVLAPFEDNEPVAVTARFRYRLKDGHLLLGYVLDQPDDVLRSAFDRIIADTQEKTSTTIMRGTPA